MCGRSASANSFAHRITRHTIVQSSTLCDSIGFDTLFSSLLSVSIVTAHDDDGSDLDASGKQSELLVSFVVSLVFASQEMTVVAY